MTKKILSQSEGISDLLAVVADLVADKAVKDVRFVCTSFESDADATSIQAQIESRLPSGWRCAQLAKNGRGTDENLSRFDVMVFGGASRQTLVSAGVSS